MKFAIVIEASVGIEDKTILFIDLSNDLKNFLLLKNYGNDLNEIIIRVICVSPEFEWFSTVKKPKFTSNSKHLKDGVEIIADKLFSYSLKINYELFKNQNEESNKKMLASEIINSLFNLDALPKKVKDFDKEKFKADIQQFFKEQNLI